MSGSRLGRGRGGRLAVYGGCGLVVVLLVVLYRAATSEMARLRDLHVQCAHQQEALAAQLQVIFEYKVRLEKSLAEEKSSNMAVKQELQQRATREKSLRDKDSIEAMQRFSSLQQTYKLLQTEHRDLLEECKEREKQALVDTNRLEATLRDLRSHIREAKEQKDKSLEHLKTKFLELDTEKTRLEEKYHDLLQNYGSTNSTIIHLQKEVFQLTRELEEVKRYANRSASPGPSIANLQLLQRNDQQMERGDDANVNHPIGPSLQQQSTVATSPKLGTSTPSGSNIPASTVLDKSLPVGKSLLKAKLPVGVPPIPMMIDQKLDNHDDKRNENAGKKKEELAKQKKNTASKENEVENGNLDPSFLGKRNDEHFPARRENGWYNVGPGIQEIGEELNHRLSGLDDGVDHNVEAGDDQYDGSDYDKEPQQKSSDLHLVGAEDEGEDEDDQIDYPHHLKQEKRD
ncbi:DNA ligase 1-like [Hylaeus anthracinus]|uniref:DNA ligase 1-like n=1 Tax=Hylaeus anthracinus TaxID=313031 RepID=UPI0023B94EFB|nr:DNA ligase 1-like [Hylaeus anthracinus]XP_054006291.1 DNA ligase 1-like [Hylaeus anthracinus]XP_054006292.1 DNA ligase 1-like [Hylaeus anthracinus]XP_054006293.1 DNA ligase 1-like [Hylaeus anthracinus]XP_054006294.1 DNA ligase 1-like [Hylaeus anthracinus]